MLFFPPPTSAAAADLLVDPAIDGLLLNGVIMPKPSELEQAQRNQQAEQLQRQLAIMGQQLQQQMPMRGSELSPTQPNVPSLIGPFSGLLTTAQIDEIEPIGSDKGTDMQMLTPANCLMPPIVGLSPIPSVSLGNTFTQLTPPIGLQQRQQPIDHIQPNLLLHSPGKIIYFANVPLRFLSFSPFSAFSVPRAIGRFWIRVFCWLMTKSGTPSAVFV
ncbi:hypothetical protein niasHT_026128 [Heterodera trifolii]|uniref:Uncharacterized protein n=1 Tax=Heterodera trifolii TaxID=157864 RepID=A0ABD2KR15_9BILA